MIGFTRLFWAIDILGDFQTANAAASLGIVLLLRKNAKGNLISSGPHHEEPGVSPLNAYLHIFSGPDGLGVVNSEQGKQNNKPRKGDVAT
ncbi:hypothetical protein LZ620_15665 [Aeromonas salmonicida]|nr:hypothetical protein [Aeromonas salmonicida]